MGGARHLSLDERISVRTPEHVALALDVAGIGSRTLAYLTDWLIRFVAVALLLFAAGRLFDLTRFLPDAWQNVQGLITAAAFFFLMWAYMPVFEVAWEGQTPGKRLTGIRVVKDDGTPITVLDAILRNVLRIIDFLPFAYGVGVFVMFLNRHSKRVGDYVAGTIVIKERDFTLDQYLERDAESNWFRSAAADPADTPAALPPVLTPAEYELITQFLDRRGDFDADTRATLARQLATPFGGRADLAGVAAEHAEPEAFLGALAARGSTSTTQVARPLTPARTGLTTPQALDRFVATRRARWERLAQHLDTIGGRGLKSFTHRQLAELGRLYRQVSADHALSQTYYPGAAVAAYLNRLTAKAHNKIYRRAGITWRTLLDFYLVEVPATFREYRRFFWLSVGAFALPAFAAFALVLIDPRFSTLGVSPQLMDYIERQEMWTDHLWLHTPGDSGIERMTETASVGIAILTNNIVVTVMVFVSGMLCGAGTVYYLMLNGFMLGTVTALTWQHGMSHDFWSFVAPHGVIEMSMILIGGMGGLILGNCILAPGRYTRRDAFRRHGRAAGRLMLACVPVLIMAGFIESSFSPMPAPLWLKVGFGLTLGAVLYAYLFGHSARRDTAWAATPVRPTTAPAPSRPDSD